jgi:hypothetical protein
MVLVVLLFLVVTDDTPVISVGEVNVPDTLVFALLVFLIINQMLY